MKMMTETDKAWLAGIVDGEGCIAFLRRTDYGVHRLEVRCDFKLAMTCRETIAAATEMAIELVGDDAVRMFQEKRKVKRTRPLWRMEINSKRGTRDFLKALLPYLRTKKLEAVVALDYLNRSADVVRYRATDRDRRLAELSKDLRNGRGETRAEALSLLGQVIPSQAMEGTDEASGSAEGVETSRVTAKNTPGHECPAPHLVFATRG